MIEPCYCGVIKDDMTRRSVIRLKNHRLIQRICRSLLEVHHLRPSAA